MSRTRKKKKKIKLHSGNEMPSYRSKVASICTIVVSKFQGFRFFFLVFFPISSFSTFLPPPSLLPPSPLLSHLSSSRLFLIFPSLLLFFHQFFSFANRGTRPSTGFTTPHTHPSTRRVISLCTSRCETLSRALHSRVTVRRLR